MDTCPRVKLLLPLVHDIVYIPLTIPDTPGYVLPLIPPGGYRNTPYLSDVL
jgi:hypothetical protein